MMMDNLDDESTTKNQRKFLRTYDIQKSWLKNNDISCNK